MEDIVLVIFMTTTSIITMLAYLGVLSKIEELKKEIEWLRKRLS